MSLRICFVASEMYPLAKTGGLADVASALPRYLHAHGHDVRVFMPLYSSINAAAYDAVPIPHIQNVELNLGAHRFWFSLMEARAPGSTAPIFLVQCPAAFDRPTLYSENPDEHLRFLVLQRAVLESCQRCGFAPQIMHCNDWHTAVMPLLLKTAYAWDRLFEATRTVMSIHNIGYQGVFDIGTSYDFGSEVRHLLDPGAAAFNQINWLREGIRHADRVTTVSPTYAKEICTTEGGNGLDGLLRARTDGVVGILNGVDYSEWNPATDRRLPHHFGPGNLAGKSANKRALLDQLNLPVSAATPLVGMISRMTPQKGFDLLFEVLPELLATRDLSLGVLGSGEWRYEDFFRRLQQRFTDRVAFHHGYNDELSHRIEAAADMFLMPSMYEPCGLNQMYSLKYGTIPIVRRTGGLADSVQMWDATTRQGTGVVFNDFDSGGVRWGLNTALDLFKDGAAWRQLMLNGMAQDFSWERQGAEYVGMYEGLVMR